MNTNCLVERLLGVSDNPNLPDFEPIEEVYGIKVGAVGQYIPLDSYIGQSKMTNLILEFEITLDTTVTSTSNRSYIFGCRSSNVGLQIEQTNAIGNIKQSGSVVNNLLTVGTKSTIKVSKVDSTAIVDNTTYDFIAGGTGTVEKGGLFTNYVGNTPKGNAKAGIFTLHTFKVYDAVISTTEPILDLIPCKNGSGKGLFYDKVSGAHIYAMNVNEGGSTDLVVVE